MLNLLSKLFFSNMHSYEKKFEIRKPFQIILLDMRKGAIEATDYKIK